MKKELPFLLNEEELSEWAFDYCHRIVDDPEIRKNITDSFWSYLYCKYIKDDPKVRKNITNSFDAFEYCANINNDLEVRKYITNKKLLKDLKNEK